MRARQAEQRVVQALFQSPGKLRFFAPHHVVAAVIALADTRQDVNGTVDTFRNHGVLEKADQRCWRFDIRCFPPARAGAGHAGDHHRQVSIRTEGR